MQTVGTLWSMGFGAILAILGGIIGTIFQAAWVRRIQRAAVKEFAVDLIDSFLHLFEKLDEHKKQSGVIWIWILDKILAEVAVYERQREQLILIKNNALRRKIQDFFTRVGLASNNLRYFIGEELRLTQAIASQSIAKLAADEKGIPFPPAVEAENARKKIEENYQELRDLTAIARELRKELPKG